MAKTKKSTRNYEVKADLSNFTLAKAKSALSLRIVNNRKKVGEIQLGRGSLYWWGRGRQRSRRVSWTKFTKMMNELAYGK
jgi:hypothetical protein